MSSNSAQDFILSASNRMDIIKTLKQLEYLETVRPNVLDKKLDEIRKIATSVNEISKSKINTYLELQEKREMVRNLLLRAAERDVSKESDKEKVHMSQRLVDKINFMRHLALAILAGAEYVNPAVRLALSRELAAEKKLADYRLDSGRAEEE